MTPEPQGVNTHPSGQGSDKSVTSVPQSPSKSPRGGRGSSRVAQSPSKSPRGGRVVLPSFPAPQAMCDESPTRPPRAHPPKAFFRSEPNPGKPLLPSLMVMKSGKHDHVFGKIRSCSPALTVMSPCTHGHVPLHSWSCSPALMIMFPCTHDRVFWISWSWSAAPMIVFSGFHDHVFPKTRS